MEDNIVDMDRYKDVKKMKEELDKAREEGKLHPHHVDGRLFDYTPHGIRTYTLGKVANDK